MTLSVEDPKQECQHHWQQIGEAGGEWVVKCMKCGEVQRKPARRPISESVGKRLLNG